jgi:hypothetical protein
LIFHSRSKKDRADVIEQVLFSAHLTDGKICALAVQKQQAARVTMTDDR